ncbi:MAG TPA: nuclear transport factor 2 family protein [Candidatus Sulfotelmatobacter sp.]|nr:nuclear transport factor 2 family protein [Candidatus Sulfotelmatobacter sp.]
MKRVFVAVAMLLSMACTATAQEKPAAKPESETVVLEAKVHKLWDAFKKKDKATLSTLIDDNFRMFEEGLSAFGDKKAEVNAVDDYELLNYTLSDFTVKPLGPNAALVTYIAQYEGKSGGETTKAKSVFGEVWVRTGNDWKSHRTASDWKVEYLQETYVK